MATKDITDLQVCTAVDSAKRWQGHEPDHSHSHMVLSHMTGEHPKVCWRALERAEGRGLIDCGVGLQRAFLTDKGRALLAGNGT